MTWLSHMVDWQLYGPKAGGHHLSNGLLHAATAVLLFLLLRQMTGRLWPSALVAAVFAIHPLRAESVAWVTERKDVLCGLFFVLALGAYVRYVRKRGWGWYLAMLVFMALGLMAKPMLVTFPFLLLLLDYWPLGRFAQIIHSPTPAGRSGLGTALRLVLEKLPLFALSIVFCVVAVWSFRGEGIEVDPRLTLLWRLENVPVAYCSYLGMFFYPLGLAVPCMPTGVGLPLWKILAAVLVVAALTAAAAVQARSRAYLLVGWLWYLGMLIPVSHLVRFGTQTVSDRFTYLPQIGLCLALTWGLADGLTRASRP